MSNKFRNSDEGNAGDEIEANWQDSYSDLVTDLLAIFVVLFSFAMMSQAVENQKAQAEAKSKADSAVIAMETSVFEGQEDILNGEESILPEKNSISPEGDNGIPNGKKTSSDHGKSKEENFNSLYESMKDYINEEGLSKVISIKKEGDSQILLRVAASVFFESGRADINPKAEPLLDRISEILTEYDPSVKMVRIEGHTDNRPIKTKQYDSNWELSTSRAVNVLRRLLEISELEPEKLSAVGYSEFYPIADNGKEAGRTKNRRVDFFIEALKD